MKVLVDSSVWIEFFQPKTLHSLQPLESLIQERQVATCLPVKSEVLSGRMSADVRQLVENAFDAMDFIDLDWSSKDTWNEIVNLSLMGRKKQASIPGIVDRMILACCLRSTVALWTLDLKLQKLAKVLHQPLFHP